ncbi:hypothetical protein C7M84_021946 [Penaeus vannamei]|uniref:Uncharacterized protein n=1 Tax=Penaeus vannamei TaxID=6689 RepID=A0A423U844_PENVA|nr:hypothetical protein C7M84_021946 [Penaeus vannamei]
MLLLRKDEPWQERLPHRSLSTSSFFSPPLSRLPLFSHRFSLSLFLLSHPTLFLSSLSIPFFFFASVLSTHPIPLLSLTAIPPRCSRWPVLIPTYPFPPSFSPSTSPPLFPPSPPHPKIPFPSLSRPPAPPIPSLSFPLPPVSLHTFLFFTPPPLTHSSPFSSSPFPHPRVLPASATPPPCHPSSLSFPLHLLTILPFLSPSRRPPSLLAPSSLHQRFPLISPPSPLLSLRHSSPIPQPAPSSFPPRGPPLPSPPPLPPSAPSSFSPSLLSRFPPPPPPSIPLSSPLPPPFAASPPLLSSPLPRPLPLAPSSLPSASPSRPLLPRALPPPSLLLFASRPPPLPSLLLPRPLLPSFSLPLPPVPSGTLLPSPPRAQCHNGSLENRPYNSDQVTRLCCHSLHGVAGDAEVLRGAVSNGMGEGGSARVGRVLPRRWVKVRSGREG